MKIILEGPDNAGKTTLAQKLCIEAKSLRYYHPGGKPAGLKEETDFCIQQIAMLSTDDILMDRCTPISQQVYNPDKMADLTRNKYLAEMRFKGPVFIYCRPSTDRLMRTDLFTWREGESEEHKQKIIEGQHTFIGRYDAIMQRVPHIAYDFESPMADVIFTKLLAAIRGSTADAKWFDDLLNYRSF